MVFEMELVKQIQINIPYILQLVKQYHDDNCQDKTIIAKIQKAIGASPDLRDKRDLIMRFIDKMTPTPGEKQKDAKDINDEWDEYVERQRDAELSDIIRQEGLRPQQTRAFVNQSLADGYVTTTGVAITKVLPPMPVFGKGANSREQKKKKVLQLLTDFYNKYAMLSSAPVAPETLQPLTLNGVEADWDVRNLVYQLIQFNPQISDAELQTEAIQQFGYYK